MSAIDFLLLGLPELSEAELAALGGGYGHINPPQIPFPDTCPRGGHYGEDYCSHSRPRPGYGN